MVVKDASASYKAKPLSAGSAFRRRRQCLVFSALDFVRGISGADTVRHHGSVCAATNVDVVTGNGRQHCLLQLHPHWPETSLAAAQIESACPPPSAQSRDSEWQEDIQSPVVN